MKANTFLSSLMALAVSALVLTACGPEYSVLPPEPEKAEVKDANTMIIYECNERLFAKENAFAAIEAYLPILQEMGVNVLWLMPIYPIGEDSASIGSPYCIKDFTAINPAFGTMDDLRSLVNKAHSLGMRVMLDWIANHTSWDNAWYLNHPEWYEGPSTGSEQYWKDVTFLNYNITAVRDTMQAAMLYWMDEADIDGFRCDYAEGVPLVFWESVVTEIRNRKSDAIMLAETTDTRHYTIGFDLLYSWDFLGGISGLYSNKGTFSGLTAANTSEYNSTPKGKERMRYVTNHDVSSGEDKDADVSLKTRYHTPEGELSAFCLTIFMGGVPMFYSSQELGTVERIDFFQYNLMDFPKDKSQMSSYQTKMTNLLKVYLDTKHLRGATQITGTLNRKVPYIDYADEKESMIVICNSSDKAQEVKLPMAHQGHTVTDLLTGETLTLGTTTTLAPYEYRIYKH